MPLGVASDIQLCSAILCRFQCHRIEHVVDFTLGGEIGDSAFTQKQHLGLHHAMRIAVLGEHRFKAISPGGGDTHVVDQLATQDKKLAGTFVPMRLKSCPRIHLHIERPLARFFADPEYLELGTATHVQPGEFVNVGK